MRAQTPQALELSGDVQGTHDPSAIRAGDIWYVFATGRAHEGGQFQIRCSNDLHTWRLCGHVFDAIPEWIRKESPGTRDLWAPDISFENGEYRLYYAYSLFGKNTSGIALATNPTLDRRRSDYASFETPCGSYGHFKIVRYLMRITGDSRYGDSMERLLCNTILGALPMQPGGRIFYYSDYNNEGHKVYYDQAWPCCSGTFPR